MVADLKPIKDYVIAQLRRTLEEQGHKLSGTLMDSIEAQSFPILNGYVMAFYYESYGVPLDTGVPAANIKFTLGSGAKTSKYIEALIKYVQARGLVSGDKDALSMAIAIARKHKKEGMSTEDSKNYSKTRKRNNWVNNTLARIDDRLTQLINDTLFVIIDDMIYNTIKNYSNG